MQENLEWLFARQRFGIHPGLTRVRALLERLDTPQTAFETILVGGTNGKGSTAASLAAMLEKSELEGGERPTGLFTSPHLTRFSERFVVDGRELAPEVVARGLARVRPHAEALEASFFEVVTALGCLLFAEAGVGRAVMEVGMGGRLDATNVLEPRLSVISNVALDHTAVLGNTPEAIAAEKAGILRAGGPAVTAVSPVLWPVLEREAADLWALGRDWFFERQGVGWSGSEVEVWGPSLARLRLATPLLGEHGAANAALAAVAAAHLGVSASAIAAGAAHTSWPGRLESLTWQGKRLVLDGAHNPAGAQALAQALRELRVPPLPLIFGAAEDKDLSGVTQTLQPFASRVILTRAVYSPRAALPADLASLFAGVPVTLTASPEAALAQLRADEPLALVCGSLYLLGELRPLLLGESGEQQERWQ